jgi:putative endonuclease
MDRICSSAAEFLAGEPRGQLTDVRFDLAMVDALGSVKVIQNAFMET